MFTGQLPVYKDKDDRYFLDGDGKIFQHILDYLRTDSLPEGINTTTLFGAMNDKTGTALHKEAMLFGLKDLASRLEKYKGPFVERQLSNFRNSMEGYQDCMDQILKAVPVNSLLGSTRTVVVLVTDGAGQQAKCCEHTCKFNYPTNVSFRPPISQEDIVSIQVSFPVDHTVLNCLYLNFTNQGYSINSGISKCNFYCEKGPVNLFRVTAFGKKTQRQCCQEPIHYIQFNWRLAPTESLFNKKGFSFGGASTLSSGFGSQNQSNTFGDGFGGQNQSNTFGGFKSSKLGATLFGSQPSGGGFFGSKVNTQKGILFGGSQPANNQGSGFSFGSAQQQNAAKSGGLVGSSPVKGFGFGSASNSEQANQKSRFGEQASQSQSGSTFSFGSPPSFGQAPSTQAIKLGSAAPSFGQAQAHAAPAFVQTPAQAFGQAQAAQAFGQAPAAPAFGQAPAAPAFGQAPVAQAFGPAPAFGQVQAAPAVVAPAFGQAVVPVAPVFANTPTGFGQVQASPAFGLANAAPAFGASDGEVNDPKHIAFEGFAVPKAENVDVSKTSK